MPTPLVGIIVGSKNDLPIVQEAADVLTRFGVAHEVIVSSAHRQPSKTAAYAKSAASRGLKILIAAAGYAAHLGGVLAAHTILPVLGVPLAASTLGGMDSLLAMVQMPAGIPVGTLTIGPAGAKNAAYLALQILALHDAALATKLQAYRNELAKG